MRQLSHSTQKNKAMVIIYLIVVRILDSSLSKVLVKTEKTSEPSVHEFEAHTVVSRTAKGEIAIKHFD